MDSGWYPDPDVPGARRYWDGREWSAPLTTEAAGMLACVTKGCDQPRLPDRWQCQRHQEMVDAHYAKTGTQPPPRPSEATALRAGSSGQAAIVCPHCGVRGKVQSRRVKQKKGISGGKATGAVLTAGFSLLATGLSRKEKATELRCGNCRVTWYA